MTTSDQLGVGPRHLTTEHLSEYVEAGAWAAVKVSGSPDAYVIVDPLRHRLAIRIGQAGHDLPDLSAYRRLSTAMVSWNAGAWAELSVEDDDSNRLLDAYPLLCAVADRVQLAAMSFTAGVRDVLATYGALLAMRPRLSEEQEVGLVGELRLLAALVVTAGTETGLAAWRGREEHDFGLDDIDVEVKTTTREKRAHWISGLDQLQPSHPRPLWLVSFMITVGGVAGRSLPDLVGVVRDACAGSTAADKLEQKLERAGWRDDQAPLYTRRFHDRSAPAVFRVDDSFPALTSDRLSLIGVDISAIDEVRYVVDLTGVAPVQAGVPSALVPLLVKG